VNESSPFSSFELSLSCHKVYIPPPKEKVAITVLEKWDAAHAKVKVKADVDEEPWTMTTSSKIKLVKDRDVGRLTKKEIVSLLVR
jgi:hypothetical protein